MGEPITKEKLMKYVSLRMEIENHLERLARMKQNEKFPAMKEPDGSKHTSFGSDRMANAVLKRLDYEERVAPRIEADIKEMDEIEAAINRLENPLEREVLWLRYIDGDHCRLMPWTQVCTALYGSDDEKHLLATYRLHGRALQNIKNV